MNAIPFVIDVPIEPKSGADFENLRLALDKLAMDDPSLGFDLGDRGEILLKGMSEEQLDVAVDLLKREHKLDLLIGAPQVAYRERLSKKVEISYIHRKLSGGFGQFAKVTLIFEPVSIGTGSSFQSVIAAGAVPKEYIPSVEKGVASAMITGVLAGIPVVDLKTTLIDGAYHETDSSGLAFEIAARAAAREALQKGSSVLIEPIMKVEVSAPEEHAGFVVGDLRSRRGESLGQQRGVRSILVDAFVPLANMFGYGSTLRSGTQGRARFSMRYSHYAAVQPRDGDDYFPPAIGMRA